MKQALCIVLFGMLFIGCKEESSTQPAQNILPWDIGQSAEAVLGRSTFTANGIDSVGQNTIPGPWGLAVSNTGTLFVVDQRGHRILRYDNADTKANGANADGVLGQSNFTNRNWNYNLSGSTPSANGVETPVSVALDLSGNLFVLDQGNSRVLRFDNAVSKTNGAAADGVLGQQNFTSKGFGSTAATFFSPQGIATDASGNLYVADGSNNRVLRFNSAASKANGTAADAVFGQTTFTSSVKGTAADKMWNPTSVAVDKNGNLYVGERGNCRVLIFLNAQAKANGATADIVLGKSDFADGTTPTSANRANIYLPYALAVDQKNNLYVADGGFNRALVFYNAPAKKNGDSADVVLGKSNFTNGTITAASETNIGQPYGIAVQSSTGKLFITCYSNSRVLRFQAKSSLVQ
ncbi:MAG: NHL repeat-containing protein [Bacteroidota bacterium]|nr:NHL repeat-containing protein [Bacteroidota bacterium]